MSGTRVLDRRSQVQNPAPAITPPPTNARGIANDRTFIEDRGRKLVRIGPVRSHPEYRHVDLVTGGCPLIADQLTGRLTSNLRHHCSGHRAEGPRASITTDDHAAWTVELN